MTNTDITRFEARRNEGRPWVWEVWDVTHPANHFPIATIDSKGASDDFHEQYARTFAAALTKPAVPDTSLAAELAAIGIIHADGSRSFSYCDAQRLCDLHQRILAALTQSPTCCEAERERCAKIADKFAADNEPAEDWLMNDEVDRAFRAERHDTAEDIATAIRGADQ